MNRSCPSQSTSTSTPASFSSVLIGSGAAAATAIEASGLGAAPFGRRRRAWPLGMGGAVSMGMSPFMSLPRLAICRRIDWNCATIRSTCSTSCSLSSAMRVRRASASAGSSPSGISRSGVDFSSSVITSIMAPKFFMLFWASRCCFGVILLPPGSMAITFEKAPMRSIMAIWLWKSLKSKLAFMSFSWMRRASSSDTASSAFSTSVSTSPMPRMRDVMRSGTKASKSSMRSPIPTNLIGRPLTSRMESAAPPRESPSSLVSSAPVMPICWLKVSTRFAASWPVMASTTSSVSSACVSRFMLSSSAISLGSTCRRPAVSMMTASKPSALPLATPSSATSTGSASVPLSKTGMPTCLPSVCSWSMAAGLYTSVPTSSTFCWRRRRYVASLPHAVVLPTPCRPAIRMTTGPDLAVASGACLPPIRLVSSSATTLTSC
mmetsp:Transcript_2855/g.8662  ORF Transcript_2855/g.8662 Transcript_2855/m.8662 type:complete len:434 (-) Transcript_2855:332-1633(-)